MALEFLGGALGGAAGLVAGHPFDTVKVRLQTQTDGRYKGMINCFRLIMAEEGAGAVFKGVTSPLVGVAFQNSLVFGFNSLAIAAMGGNEDPGNQAVAGGIAGLAQSFVASPMELIKTRLQLQGQGTPDFGVFDTHSNADVYRGPVDCYKQILRTEGLRGVYRGLGITLLRDAPGFSIYFYSYEKLTRWYDPRGSKYLSSVPLLIAGGLAGVSSWILTYPQDIIKSRYQADGVYPGSQRYRSARDCLRQTVSEEGVGALFRGMNSAIARAFVLNAVTFWTVEWVVKMYGRYQLIDELSPNISKRSISSSYHSASTILLPLNDFAMLEPSPMFAAAANNVLPAAASSIVNISRHSALSSPSIPAAADTNHHKEMLVPSPSATSASSSSKGGNERKVTAETLSSVVSSSDEGEQPVSSIPPSGSSEETFNKEEVKRRKAKSDEAKSAAMINVADDDELVQPRSSEIIGESSVPTPSKSKRSSSSHHHAIDYLMNIPNHQYSSSTTSSSTSPNSHHHPSSTTSSSSSSKSQEQWGSDVHEWMYHLLPEAGSTLIDPHLPISR